MQLYHSWGSHLTVLPLLDHQVLSLLPWKKAHIFPLFCFQWSHPNLCRNHLCLGSGTSLPSSFSPFWSLLHHDHWRVTPVILRLEWAMESPGRFLTSLIAQCWGLRKWEEVQNVISFTLPAKLIIHPSASLLRSSIYNPNLIARLISHYPFCPDLVNPCTSRA